VSPEAKPLNLKMASKNSIFSEQLSPKNMSRIQSPALKGKPKLAAIKINAQLAEWKKLINKFERKKKTKLVTNIF